MDPTYDHYDIETEIRYLTTAEGGKTRGVFSGYRGQSFYDGTDYDGFQFFPDVPDGQMIALGTPVRALVRFAQDRWLSVHSQKITVGMPFEIREGAKTVGRGRVTKV